MVDGAVIPERKDFKCASAALRYARFPTISDPVEAEKRFSKQRVIFSSEARWGKCPLHSEKAVEEFFDRVAQDCRHYQIAYADYAALVTESVDSEVIREQLTRLDPDERNYEGLVDCIILFLFPRSSHYARLRAELWSLAADAPRANTVIAARHRCESLLRSLSRAGRRRKYPLEVSDFFLLQCAEGHIPASVYRRMALTTSTNWDDFWTEAQLWDSRAMEDSPTVHTIVEAPPAPSPDPDTEDIVNLVMSALEARQQQNRCYRCGTEGHWARQCPYASPQTTCANCGSKGHLPEACRKTFYSDAAGNKTLEVNDRPGGLQVRVPADRTTLDRLETGKRAIEKVVSERRRQNQVRNQTRRAKKPSTNPLLVGAVNEPPRSGSENF